MRRTNLLQVTPESGKGNADADAALNRSRHGRTRMRGRLEDGGKVKRRIIILAIAISVCHVVIWFTMFGVYVEAVSQNFDNPEREINSFERIAGHVCAVLAQPGYSLWTPWMSRNMPDSVEWAFFIGSSLLWGFAIALLIHLKAILRTKRSPNQRIRP